MELSPERELAERPGPTRPIGAPERNWESDRSRPQAILTLQRTIGNRAVNQLIQRVNANGSITDVAEMERDRPVGGTVDVPTRSRLLDRVRAAARGAALFGEVSRLRGNLDFPMKWSARGTYHRTGEMWIDRNGNYERWCAGVAHEVTHLITYLGGRAANIQTMTHDEFVAAKMTDEINAHAASYVVLLQLGVTGSDAAGYNQFRTQLTTAAPNAVSNSEWDRIEGLARTFIEDKYRTEWATSNTGENYYAYWGAAWDAAHPHRSGH